MLLVKRKATNTVLDRFDNYHTVWILFIQVREAYKNASSVVRADKNGNGQTFYLTDGQTNGRTGW